MSALIYPSKIVLKRAEGPVQDLGEKIRHTWDEANTALAAWATTAPGSPGRYPGGYDKVDFRVEWPDGMVWEGRYDLTSMGESGDTHYGFDLARHIGQFLDFHLKRVSQRQLVLEGVTPKDLEFFRTLRPRIPWRPK